MAAREKTLGSDFIAAHTGPMKRILLSFSILAVFANQAPAQSTSSNSGTIRGSVVDPSGAAIPKATVEIQNPVSHYTQTTHTDDQGNFVFANIPYNPYHASAVATGFQSTEQDVEVRSPIPLQVKITLNIGTSTDSVTVVAAGDLIEVGKLGFAKGDGSSGCRRRLCRNAMHGSLGGAGADAF